MSGSIVANAGFKEQFGVKQRNGTYTIDTTWGKLHTLKRADV